MIQINSILKVKLQAQLVIEERKTVAMLRVLLAALALSVLLSASAHAQVYAVNDGALICNSPEPLKTYVELLGDAEAKAKYLKSGYVWQCKQVAKDTESQLMEANGQFVRLRAKGEFDNVYGVVSEWALLKSAERARQQSAAQVQALCRSFGEYIHRKISDAAEKIRIGNVHSGTGVFSGAKTTLTLTKEGTLASVPQITILPRVSSSEATDFVTKAIYAAQPFTLPQEHYEMWKKITVSLDFGYTIHTCSE